MRLGALYHRFWLEEAKRAAEAEQAKKSAVAQAEAARRAELAAAPDDWMVQAKLAQSLLETNGSRIIPAPARLEEGRRLAEAA